MKISDFMKETGTGFGTSGVRSLVTKLTDCVCYVYTLAFIQYLESKGDLKRGMSVAIAGDLRSSTDRLMRAVGKAIIDRGYDVKNMGKIPSPAIALYGMQHKVPAIMVTGSHIPDDRNGIKYNKPAGEILKTDEQGIKEQDVSWDASLFDEDGLFVSSVDFTLPPLDDTARKAFVQRYLDFFPNDLLKGKKVGLYQHSAVGRDIFKEILEGLGADVIPMGRSEKFIPVDTEAIRPEDKELAREEAPKYFALVSTDGDSDRPLIAGQSGEWFRGDVLGILVSKFLNADAVATPVSCNTALEKSGWFTNVMRTRIGSPYVIAAMNEAVSKGEGRVVSYEANGGFLTATDVEMFGKKLTALPTRDAFLPILTVLWSAVKDGVGVSDFLDRLPKRFTASDRLKEFPREKSAALLAELSTGNFDRDRAAIETMMGKLFGKVHAIDTTDGVRITFESGEIVHYRPSGNAPEFRCYTEAGTEERALEMNAQGLALARELAGHL
jgi:phosphomannomutase